MELHFPFSLNFTFLTLPFFLIFILKPFIQICKTLIKNTTSQPKLPPGPRKLPLIGNLLNVAGLRSPHRALAALSEIYGPIVHLKLGEISAVVISSPHLVKEALSTNDLAFSNRPGGQATKIMFYNHMDFGFCPYGDYWKQMRKICAEEFLSVAKVRSLCSIREEETWGLVESIRKNCGLPIDLTKEIYSLQNVVITRAVVGNHSMNQDALMDIVKETLSLAGGFDIVDFFPSFKFFHDPSWVKLQDSKLKKMHQKFDKILDNIINEHIKNLGQIPSTKEDLLAILLRVKESRRLNIPITNTNIKAVMMDMFTGTDTSSTVIEWAMAEMLRNPGVMEKAQAELRKAANGKKTINEKDIQECTYLKLVVKETIRLHIPLAFLVPRECREQCEVGGYTIPVKTHLLVNAWAMARDPQHWHDGESFIPERFEGMSCDFNGNNFEYVPFGTGRRMCPGLSFGIANVELTLAQLLFNFDWKLPNGQKPEDLDMTETFGASVKLKNSLHVMATPSASV